MPTSRRALTQHTYTEHTGAGSPSLPLKLAYVKARPKRKTLRHICTYATVNANKRSGDAQDTGLTATGAAAGWAQTAQLLVPVRLVRLHASGFTSLSPAPFCAAPSACASPGAVRFRDFLPWFAARLSSIVLLMGACAASGFAAPPSALAAATEAADDDDASTYSPSAAWAVPG